MVYQSNNWKGFDCSSDDVSTEGKHYVLHRDDGEQISDKIVTHDELVDWCQLEFETLAATAIEELVNGETVVTHNGVFSLDEVDENFTLSTGNA